MYYNSSEWTDQSSNGGGGDFDICFVPACRSLSGGGTVSLTLYINLYNYLDL